MYARSGRVTLFFFFSQFRYFLPSHFSPHQTQNENEFETFLSSSFAATHLSLCALDNVSTYFWWLGYSLHKCEREWKILLLFHFFFSWTTTAEHRVERRVRQGALQALVNKASEGRGTASLQQSDEKVFVWRKSIEWNECNMNMVGTDLMRHRPDNSTLFLRFLSFLAACERAQLLNTSITFPAHEMTSSLRLVTISSPFLFPPTAARKPSTVSRYVDFCQSASKWKCYLRLSKTTTTLQRAALSQWMWTLPKTQLWWWS